MPSKRLEMNIFDNKDKAKEFLEAMKGDAHVVAFGPTRVVEVMGLVPPSTIWKDREDTDWYIVITSDGEPDVFLNA